MEPSAQRWFIAPLLSCFTGANREQPRPESFDTAREAAGASGSAESAAAPPTNRTGHMARCDKAKAHAKNHAHRADFNSSCSLSYSERDGSSRRPAASYLSEDHSSGLQHYASSNLAGDANRFDSFPHALASNNNALGASCSPDSQALDHTLTVEARSTGMAGAARLHRLPARALEGGLQTRLTEEPAGGATLQLEHGLPLRKDPIHLKQMSSPEVPNIRLCTSLDEPAAGAGQTQEFRRLSLQLLAVTWSSSCDGVWRPHCESRASPFSPTLQQRQAAGAALAARAARYALVASQDRSLDRLVEQMRAFKQQQLQQQQQQQQQQAAELQSLEPEASEQVAAQRTSWVSEDVWDSDANASVELGADQFDPGWLHAPGACPTSSLRHGQPCLTTISEAADSGPCVLQS